VKVPLVWIVVFSLLGEEQAAAKTAQAACGTYAERVREEVLAHRVSVAAREQEKLLRKLYGMAAVEAPKGASQDVGDIAVMEEDAGIVSRRNLFNLEGRTLRFRPMGNGYEVSNVGGSYNAEEQRNGAVAQGLGDDDSREVSLPFEFSYFGARYRKVFLNSDGNLSFDAGDGSTRERSLGRLLSGLPRIGGFFTDLDPSRAGSVHVLAQADRLVVTWLAVPEYVDFGVGARNTFQIRLLADGTIEIAYEDTDSLEAIVGVAPGRLAGGTNVVSFSTLTTPSTLNGAVAERFRASEEVDTLSVAQRFYETHEDAYDYLAIYNTLGISPGPGVVAFEVTVRNNRTGYGDQVLDFGTEYGSPRRLQALLNMGPVSQYPVDPNGILPQRFTARDTPTTVLAHEAGHLFLAFASVPEPNNPAVPAMLGRQSAHWGFTFNSEASLLEGNRILDRGAGASPRFETVAVTEQYSPLDQYLMGLRAKEEVGPLFYVGDSTISTLFPPPPQVGRTFDGTRRDVSVDDLIAVHGRRTPDHTVSQRKYRFAVIVIAPRGAATDSAQVRQVDAYRRSFESFYNRATGERAIAETTLRKQLDVSVWPAAGTLVGREFEAELRLGAPAANALMVNVSAARGLVETPSSVTIAAGARSAKVRLRAVREGVEELRFRPSDAAYMEAEARVQVAGGARQLQLNLVSGDGQRAAGDGFLAQPLVLRLSDLNRLAYPGLRVVARAEGNGVVEPASASTGEDGSVSFRWRPGTGARVTFGLEGVPAEELSAVATAFRAPFFTSQGVVNGASFVSGLTSQGLHTIFGTNLAARAVAAPFPWPRQVEGVQVRVNGEAQPIVFVSEGQVNFYQADSLSGSEATVEVESGGGSLRVGSVPVRNPQPGIFTINAAGEGATIRRGEFLEVYGTGFTGVAQAEVWAFWNGVEIPVQFSGLAPGFVGLQQVNVRLPAGAAGSNRLRLRVVGVESNEVRVTLP
jgi:uncharacterized protein (TIGR03437 family)